MAISWDPKNKAASTVSGTDESTRTPSNRAPSEAASVAEPVAMVDDPTRAQAHPTRPQPANATQLDESLRNLRAALRSNQSEQVRAAQQALAWCSGYAMRRSRGARKRGVALLDELADSGIEGTDVAAALGEVLRAEGRLHELSDEGTADACHRLVTLLMALEKLPS